MLQAEDITIKSFKTRRVIQTKNADLVLDKHSGLLDYISLGTYCLYRSLVNFPGDTIQIAKRDFSKYPSSATAFLGNRCLELPESSFSTVACRYVERIANQISGREHIGNIALGVELSMFLSLHCLGEKVLIGINKNEIFPLSEILPTSWDMKDTEQAQRLAFNLIKTVFEVCVEPFGL